MFCQPGSWTKPSPYGQVATRWKRSSRFSDKPSRYQSLIQGHVDTVFWILLDVIHSLTLHLQYTVTCLFKQSAHLDISKKWNTSITEHHCDFARSTRFVDDWHLQVVLWVSLSGTQWFNMLTTCLLTGVVITSHPSHLCVITGKIV